jgi:hypothetical protein
MLISELIAKLQQELGRGDRDVLLGNIDAQYFAIASVSEWDDTDPCHITLYEGELISG